MSYILQMRKVRITEVNLLTTNKCRNGIYPDLVDRNLRQVSLRALKRQRMLFYSLYSILTIIMLDT